MSPTLYSELECLMYSAYHCAVEVASISCLIIKVREHSMGGSQHGVLTDSTKGPFLLATEVCMWWPGSAVLTQAHPTMLYIPIVVSLPGVPCDLTQTCKATHGPMEEYNMLIGNITVPATFMCFGNFIYPQSINIHHFNSLMESKNCSSEIYNYADSKVQISLPPTH